MPEDSKDEKYWRRRAKNNEAAKRSREAKRQKEDEVLHKVEELESENAMLRYVRMKNDMDEKLIIYLISVQIDIISFITFFILGENLKKENQKYVF